MELDGEIDEIDFVDYAIDVKNFREAVQGLAMQFPKHIRVSFVANLDNIILEKYSSLEILDLAEE